MEDRIQRVTAMEARLGRVLAWLESGAGDVREDARLLDAYYRSPAWRADFEADEAGLFPPGLRRGVLSEDGVYNALTEYEEKTAAGAGREPPDPACGSEASALSGAKKTKPDGYERSKTMNSILDAIKTRRSVRAFKPDMPTREELEKIVEAGLYAASGKGLQSSMIVAITDRALRDRLMEMNRVIGGWKEGFDPFYGAPAVLLVLADRQSANHVYDGSLTMGNMMLAAHALGLGSCWINRAREEFDSEEGKAILRELGIEGDWEGIGHCVVGYADGALPAAKPRREGRVVWAE